MKKPDTITREEFKDVLRNVAAQAFIITMARDDNARYRALCKLQEYVLDVCPELLHSIDALDVLRMMDYGRSPWDEDAWKEDQEDREYMFRLVMDGWAEAQNTDRQEPAESEE